MKSLLSILVIAVCVGAYFLYIKPMTLEVKVLSAKKSEYTDVLNRVKEIKEKRDAISAEYDSISAGDIERLKKIIPETLNPVLLLNDLSVLGSKHGIVIKDFKASENDGGDRSALVSNSGQIYKTTTINLKINGEYSKFIDFIKEVQSGLSLIDIVSLDIKGGSGPSKTNKTDVMDFILETNTYSLR